MNHHTRSASAVRSRLSRHRSVRADQRRLERELASYTSPSERDELAAILARHPAEAVRPIERILLRR